MLGVRMSIETGKMKWLWKESVLWKDGDVGRCEEGGVVVAVYYAFIRK